MKALSETDVQQAIKHCFDESIEFQQKFLKALELPVQWQTERLRLESALQSVTTKNGETDIDTLWLSDSGERYGILCEVKLKAQFTPQQGQRYQQRIDNFIKDGRVNAAISVLIAHSSYLKALTQRRVFLTVKYCSTVFCMGSMLRRMIN